jgi:nitroreductase/NAD-dependent dihydropyrimidine dehydrogenase PreA subunit
MPIFAIDQSKCHQDGLCAAECPLMLIQWEGKGSFPQAIPGAEALCINCGHCAAVCPHGALSLGAMPLETMPALEKTLKITPQQAEQFLRGRRSIRQYKPEPAPRETLQRLIDLARYAPSGHNIQPVQWLVLSGPEQIRVLAGHTADWMRYMLKENAAMAQMMHLDLVVARWDAGQDRILRDAPHVILAHAPKAERTAPTAATIALTYLELAATTLGLGTCWAGYFGFAATVFPPLIKALALPEGHAAMGAMMVGYPKAKYFRLPERNQPAVTWR